MQQATDPRQLADLCRRLANVPTSGGYRADRVLNELADKLDREAAQADHAKIVRPTHSQPLPSR
jgi:hypothetical protein